MTKVIQIRLSLSNSLLILGERPILVDTGSPKDGKKLLRKLAQHGVQDLALILHAHGHKKLPDLGATKFLVGHGGPLEAGRVRSWLEQVGDATRSDVVTRTD